MPFITSDWHIHTVASYDAHMHVADLVHQADAQGVTDFGITDHVNLPSWIHYLRASRELYLQFQRPGFHFGVELTTISGHIEAYDRLHGSRDGYEHPGTPDPDPIAFPLTAEEIDASGAEYVIGAGHWLLNTPSDHKSVLREMHCHNLYCACSPLVDIVGHPYYMIVCCREADGSNPLAEDFSLIPQSMHDELYAAMLEHGKAMEINAFFFTGDRPEASRRQYAEFARAAFERGIPVTIGTDTHTPKYDSRNDVFERYLAPVGFRSEDFSAPAFRKRT